MEPKLIEHLTKPKENKPKSKLNFRSTIPEDVPAIRSLHNQETDFYFGKIHNIERYLETMIYPTTFLNDLDEVIGFICFDIVPNIPAIEKSDWLCWLNKHFDTPNCNYKNTLFVHYLVFEISANPNILRMTLNELFLDLPVINYIIFIEPSVQIKHKDLYVYHQFYNSWSTPYSSKFLSRLIIHPKLYIIERDDIMSHVTFRCALAEDNDSIVNILDKKYPYLKENYGEFYVAQQILTNDKRKYLVMEENYEVCGVMLINEEPDLKFLNLNFELGLLNCLIKSEPDAETDLIITKNITKKLTEEFVTSRYFNLRPGLLQHRRATKYIFDPPELDVGSKLSSDSTKSESTIDLDLLYSFQSTSEEEISLPDHSHSFGRLAELRDFSEIKIIDSYPNYVIRNKIIEVPHGKSNAFKIDFFAVDTEIVDERRLFELLRVSFALCSDKEYCIMLVKTTESNQQLLGHFTYIPQRPQLFSNLSLYVVHRNALVDEVDLNFIKSEDLPEIKKFLKYDNSLEKMRISTEKNFNEIIEIIETNLVKLQHKYYCFTIKTLGSIIGIGICCDENHLSLIQKYYYANDSINYEMAENTHVHGRILHLLVNPLFDASSGTIFLNISRLTGYKFFYYGIKDKEFIEINNNLLGKMFPLEPVLSYDISDKILNKYRADPIDDNEREDPIEDNEFDDPFPLYFLAVNNCTKLFTNIDLRIVCLGFDDVCKGFLKEILFKKELMFYKFQNITVISLPCELECLTTEIYDQVYKLLNWKTYFGPKYINRLGLRVWINFQATEVFNINRKEKTLILHDKTMLKYDYLILTCNVQFSSPSFADWKITPANYHTINFAMEAALLMHKMKILKSCFPSGFDLIIYGNVLNAYSCINHLLKNGISGYAIHFVIIGPYDELNSGAFDDKNVEKIIMNELEEYGVKIYNGFRFLSWNILQDSNFISSVTFKSKFEMITIKCQLFISYNKKNIYPRYLKVLERCRLLTDGRIVINGHFQTSDPFIYAAGSATQYMRALLSHKYIHLYYDNFEIGEELANNFIQNCVKKSSQGPSPKKIPIFKNPISNQMFLPGGYLLFTIRQCGKTLPSHIAKLFERTTTTITWNKERPKSKSSSSILRLSSLVSSSTTPSKRPNRISYSDDIQNLESEYFSLNISQNGELRSLTCLTKSELNLDFLTKLFSNHTKFVNKFVERWESGERIDPLKFFTQSWMKILIFPRFDILKNQNRNFIVNELLSDPTVGTMVKKYLKAKKLCLSESERKSILKVLNTDKIIKTIELNLINFINKHHYHLLNYKKCDINVPYFLDFFEKHGQN